MKPRDPSGLQGTPSPSKQEICLREENACLEGHDLTFFDLSNPIHLSQLVCKMEEIQRQEQMQMPKVILNEPDQPKSSSSSQVPPSRKSNIEDDQSASVGQLSGLQTP